METKTITQDELIRQVEANMEELLPQEEFDALEFDGMGIREYIQLMLPESIIQIFSIAPTHLLSLKSFDKVITPQKQPDGSGTLSLPDDLLRMVELKMKGWHRSVTRFILPSQPEFELQMNKYLRGGTEKPVATITHNDEGQRAIRYFSLPPYVRLHEVEKALYVALPLAELQEEYVLHPQIINAVAYACAAIIYNIMGKPDRALIMTQRIIF